MKKTFKTFALMLLAAVAFSSCVDVPTPYELPVKEEAAPEEEVLPAGDGTLENPYNVAKLQELIAAEQAPTTEIYIKGIISQIKSLDVSKYTRAQYYISDNGKTTNQFYVYNGLFLNGENFTANDQIKVGDVVVIQGTLGTFNNSYQVAQNSKIIRLNDAGDTGGSSTPEGAAITCSEALEKINALEDGKSTDETYSVTGYITDVFVISGKPCFWMSDENDGNKVIQAFNYILPQGVTALNVGMKVTATGKLLRYVNKNTGAMTPEVDNPSVKVLEDGGGSSDNDASVIADFTKGQGAWTVNNVSGPSVWTNSSQYGQVASGFDNTNKVCQAAEGWLLSPEIDLTNGTNSQIVLYEAVNKVGTGSSVDVQCQVLACINGNNEWQLLTADKRPEGTSWTFQDDTFDASAFDGKKIQLAFKYTSTESSAPSWEIKTVTIKGGGSSSQGGEGGGNEGGEAVTELVNGGFENWVSDSEAEGWKSASSASSATVSKSSDAHDGSFACLIAAGGSANKRLATQEMTLEAGSYKFSYYAKAATAAFAQTKGGYVHVNDDGRITDSYQYPKTFTDLNNNEWTLVTNEFELTSRMTVCIVIMNPKNNTNPQYTSQDILVDDAKLEKIE